MKKLLTLATLSALLGSSANAQGTLSAQSIIVNPAPSSVAVRVWTDRDSSGTAVPAYTPGEKIRLYASVNQDAYVYLFNVDPNGAVNMILPNNYQGGANFLKANTVRAFPAAGDPYTFDIAAPYGTNKVLALASKTPLNLRDIATFKSQQSGFATVNVQGQQQLAQALSIVVQPIQQNTWNSATAYYQVVTRSVAAPVQPARPIVVQPAPVRPVPVRPAPAPVFNHPWGNQRTWNASMDSRSDLRQLHDQYAAYLRAEGFTLTSSREKRNEIESTFRNAQGQQATLELKRKGNRVEIKVERNNIPENRNVRPLNPDRR